MIQWSGNDRGHRATGTIIVDSYPSGEPLIRHARVTKIDRLMVCTPSISELMAALFFVDALCEHGDPAPNFILPYVPGARQDRLSGPGGGDFLFTAKSVARAINARAFPSVTVVDPHSEVIPALIDRCRVLHAVDCIIIGQTALSSYAAVVSPDGGAEKRAGAVARFLGIPLVHAWKTRSVATGAISGFGLEQSGLTGRVLVVDDICDAGGTFIGLADMLDARKLTADLYVTHGLFTKGTESLAKRYGRIFVSDSFGSPPPCVFIPVCQRLLEGTIA